MSELNENDFSPLEPQPFVTEEGREIERLRAELADMREQRDEARRLYCVEMSRQSTNPTRWSPEWGAKQLGWDCFGQGGGA